MRGHIRKRGQSYSLVLSEGYDPVSGRRRQRWVTFHGTRKEAEAELARLICESGAADKFSQVTTGEFLRRWLRDYAPNVGARTLEGYESKLRRHVLPYLDATPLAELHGEHLQALYARMLKNGGCQRKDSLSARSVHHVHVILHRAFACAMKWEVIARNPADAATPPRVARREMRVWDEGQVQRFLASVSASPVFNIYYPLFFLALYTGLRRSELLALRWRDASLVQYELYVQRSLQQMHDGRLLFQATKSTRSNRPVTLTPSTVAVLCRHLKEQRAYRLVLGIPWSEDGLLFAQPDGRPFLPDSVSHAWAKCVGRLELPRIRLHDARHTHASLLLKARAHPKVVQERLGHASIQTTVDTYSHLLPGMQQEAAARFDDIMGQNSGQLLPPALP